MAAAYAGLVSLMHIMDQIRQYACHSFSLNKEQIESLQERVTFLLDFLEGYSHGDNKEVEALESQITDATHTAEDIIESRVVDYIHDNRSTNFDETRSNPFCQRLQEAIEVMDLMKKEAMKIKEEGEVKVQLPRNSKPSSSSSSLRAGKNTMVGFDEVLNQIMERLTGQQSDCQIIPISGMGGIGKTTLTRNVYENHYIVRHFDIRAWVTISQEYEIKEILTNLLCEFGVLSKETAQGMNESKLGEKLHKYLFGRKYLIVMDDMWSIDVWEKVRLFFPDNGNGSGIMITTRLSKMASHLGSRGLEVDFLDEDQSWNLLCKKVFGQEKCSIELEEIGKKIAKNCKGLPLSIVVIGGLLAKSNMTIEYWDHVAKEVSSIVSLADDEHYSKVLSVSYKHLPVHLKPCFLYMGVFPEDHEIHVSRLIKLWVAEGFLKPNKAKSFEEIAEEYLTELIDRNLIMAHKQGSRGNLKTCKVHDLLGDLCLREAQKEKFFCVIGPRSVDISQDLHGQRHIVIQPSIKEQKNTSNLNNLDESPVSLARSITYNTGWGEPLLGCRLLRVLSRPHHSLLEIAFDLVNLRYLSFETGWRSSFEFPYSINLLWNLQTLIIRGTKKGTTAPPEIWEMKQLRHLDFGEVCLPNPPPIASKEDSNLKNLQTLSEAYNLLCSEEVLERIPNIKKLKIVYEDISGDFNKGIEYNLSNIHQLHKIESLALRFGEFPNRTRLLTTLIFPHSLKKLILCRSCIPWKRMKIIGSLPNLEVLKLRSHAFIGQEWNPIEGQFLSLKFLLIDWCPGLKFWTADSIHFPSLEQLFIYDVISLEKIPLGIGEIPTLRSIQLKYCSDSAVASAKDILDEQESFGNDGIQVQVWLAQGSQLLENLEASDNFKFIVGERERLLNSLGDLRTLGICNHDSSRLKRNSITTSSSSSVSRSFQ